MESCETTIVKVPCSILHFIVLHQAVPDRGGVRRAIGQWSAQGWTLLSRREEAPRKMDLSRYRDCYTVLVFRRCPAATGGSAQRAEGARER